MNPKLLVIIWAPIFHHASLPQPPKTAAQTADIPAKSKALTENPSLTGPTPKGIKVETFRIDYLIRPQKLKS